MDQCPVRPDGQADLMPDMVYWQCSPIHAQLGLWHFGSVANLFGSFRSLWRLCNALKRTIRIAGAFRILSKFSDEAWLLSQASYALL